MGLTKGARLVELYYKNHPEKLIVKSKHEIALEEVEIEFEPILVDALGDITLSTNDLVSMQKLFKEN